MSFLDDIESDAADIFSGEFSKAGVLITPALLTLAITLIFDETTIDIDTDGNMIISENSQAQLYLKPIDDFIGSPLTENQNMKIKIDSVTYGIKMVSRFDSNTGLITFKR